MVHIITEIVLVAVGVHHSIDYPVVHRLGKREGGLSVSMVVRGVIVLVLKIKKLPDQFFKLLFFVVFLCHK